MWIDKIIIRIQISLNRYCTKDFQWQSTIPSPSALKDFFQDKITSTWYFYNYNMIQVLRKSISLHISRFRTVSTQDSRLVFAKCWSFIGWHRSASAVIYEDLSSLGTFFTEGYGGITRGHRWHRIITLNVERCTYCLICVTEFYWKRHMNSSIKFKNKFWVVQDPFAVHQ